MFNIFKYDKFFNIYIYINLYFNTIHSNVHKISNIHLSLSIYLCTYTHSINCNKNINRFHRLTSFLFEFATFFGFEDFDGVTRPIASFCFCDGFVQCSSAPITETFQVRTEHHKEERGSYVTFVSFYDCNQVCGIMKTLTRSLFGDPRTTESQHHHHPEKESRFSQTEIIMTKRSIRKPFHSSQMGLQHCNERLVRKIKHITLEEVMMDENETATQSNDLF